MRVMDMMLAFPTLVLALAITAALGPSLTNALIAIGIVSMPSFARLARAQTLAAARASSSSRRRGRSARAAAADRACGTSCRASARR